MLKSLVTFLYLWDLNNSIARLDIIYRIAQVAERVFQNSKSLLPKTYCLLIKLLFCRSKVVVENLEDNERRKFFQRFIKSLYDLELTSLYINFKAYAVGSGMISIL